MNPIDFVRQQLQNEFFSGGLLLTLIMGTLAMLRHAPFHLWRLTSRKLITTVDITDHDQAFYWVQGWLSQHEYTKRSKLLTLSTRTRPPTRDGGSPIEKASNERKRNLPAITFSPAPGTHLFRHQGHFILLTRTRTETDTSVSDVAFHETIVIRAFSKQVIQNLIHDAREHFFPPDDNRIGVYRAGPYSWRLAQRRFARSLDSVVLNGNMAEQLLTDIQWFLGAQNWYGEHGIPYQRGYMLEGPPGNGKTSIVVALAGVLGRDIYIMGMAGLNDGQVANLMSELPEQSIMLIEDVDGAFIGRERTKDASEQLTFSGMLNAIDGMAAPTGRLLFMTTNHPENVDAALLRPGRSDKRIKLTNATPDMARRLFLRFFPNNPGIATELETAIKSSTRQYSMAEVQELLIENLNSPGLAVVKVLDSSCGPQTRS